MAKGRFMSIDQSVSHRDQEFVTVPEAARRLGRSKLSLYQACGRGEVPGAFKIGAKWLVNWSAFVKATETARGLMTEQA
jgi:predicted DNA-binding transcriptional regulator AlpA